MTDEAVAAYRLWLYEATAWWAQHTRHHAPPDDPAFAGPDDYFVRYEAHQRDRAADLRQLASPEVRAVVDLLPRTRITPSPALCELLLPLVCLPRAAELVDCLMALAPTWSGTSAELVVTTVSLVHGR